MTQRTAWERKADNPDAHRERRDKTNRALFELGRKVHELEQGLEYWVAAIKAIGEEIETALNQEREDDA